MLTSEVSDTSGPGEADVHRPAGDRKHGRYCILPDVYDRLHYLRTKHADSLTNQARSSASHSLLHTPPSGREKTKKGTDQEARREEGKVREEKNPLVYRYIRGEEHFLVQVGEPCRYMVCLGPPPTSWARAQAPTFGQGSHILNHSSLRIYN